MAVNRAANRFANALFTIAEEKNNIFGIKTSLEELVKLYRKNAEFRFIVLSKRIEKKQKIKILKNSIVGKINSKVDIIEIKSLCTQEEEKDLIT